jgi:nitrate/nitrite-specific signal transduction histidine kinase
MVDAWWMGVRPRLPDLAPQRDIGSASWPLLRRSAIPVDLDLQVDRRLPEPVEIAAYYTAAEALTNAAKHANATTADIEVAESAG